MAHILIFIRNGVTCQITFVNETSHNTETGEWIDDSELRYMEVDGERDQNGRLKNDWLSREQWDKEIQDGTISRVVEILDPEFAGIPEAQYGDDLLTQFNRWFKS